MMIGGIGQYKGNGEKNNKQSPFLFFFLKTSLFAGVKFKFEFKL